MNQNVYFGADAIVFFAIPFILSAAIWIPG